MSFEADRLIIRPIQGAAEVEQCALMLSSTDPWVRLGATYESCLGRFQDADKEIYVAELDGAIVGLLIVNMKGAFFGYIQTLCIAETHRSQGIGTALIKWAESRIFKESPNVFMCVSSFNPEACRLYENLGYSIVGELTDYIIKDHSELLLRKSLSAWADFKRE
jgi:[ribosomal protein S18]-alanine N-acetyltransferase